MPPEYKRRAKRYHMKPTSMGNLISGVLGRHNISRQVTSSLVVQEVNRFLEDTLENHVRVDVRALSFANHELKIACRNPAASFVMQDYIARIEHMVKQSFPDIILEKIHCIINQDPWLQRGYE